MSDSPTPAVPPPEPETSAFGVFVRTEVAGAAVLIAAAIAALIWANSPWQTSYRELWQTPLSLHVRHLDVAFSLRECVNEGLMSLFFFVVALEVKREFLHGELHSARRAALPVFAAVGGMVVPAALYTLVNVGGAAAGGWAIPMATDIAFALGVLALVAPGLPSSVRVFLLALAIVDDIGAIVVIAGFYSGPLDLVWLAVAAGALAIVYLSRRGGLTFAPLYIALGVGLWGAFVGAGVEATIAGVAMGLLVPDRRNLERALQPWTSWLVVPTFALANAGVTLSAGQFGDSVTSSVTVGVLVGLVAGKAIGITGASWVACRAGFAELPSEAGWRELIGTALIAGIGFTVSLFITGLAFDESALASQAKVGIFAAAIIAAGLGASVLRSGNVATRGRAG
jgi:NhaA family Na+:H+ antiporter